MPRRLAVLALLLAAAPAAAQEPLVVRPAPDDHRPVVVVGPVLAGDGLREALVSGLPVRMRFRAELWRDELIDDLEADAAFTLVLRYEPLEGRYHVFDERGTPFARVYASYAQVRAAVESEYALPIRPRGPGRYYYLAVLEVETLALSDLDELEGWLRGELQPAVSGGGSVLGAIGAGARRLFIRILGLPARRLEARSPLFTLR